MKRVLLILFSAMFFVFSYAKGNKQSVIFDVDIHCQKCIEKIEKNIAFEKGVKDMQCSLENKTVKIVFDDSKTNVEQLISAFKSIGKTAKVKENTTK